MFEPLFALVCMFGAALVLWGWGRGVRRLAGNPPLTVPIEMALGMAVMIFVGGVLNLLRVAFQPALDVMLILGGLSALREAWVTRWQRPALTKAHGIAAIPIMAVAALLLTFLTPPAVFNWHDDLERYFMYPIKMLATGTVGGNPLGYMGADSLGAQAFLQAFVTAHFPLRQIGAVDWIFALLLCMAIAGYGVAPRGWGGYAILAELLVFAINPLLVNVSSTFTTVALILGLVFLTTYIREGSRVVWLIGFFYSALLALKTTNAVFVGLHFLALLLTAPEPFGRSALRRASIMAISTCLLLAPWVLTHAANFVSFFRPLKMTTPPTQASEPLLLFANALGAYGVSPFCYTFLSAAGLGMGFMVWFRRRERSDDEFTVRAIAAACFAAVAAYLAMTVWLAPLVFGQIASFRYVAPVLIGVVPALVALGATMPGRAVRTSLLVAFVGSLLLFAPSTIVRVRTLISDRTTLAFLSSKGALHALAQTYSPYLGESLGDIRRERIEKIQSLVPADEPIVSWLMTPYWLNFRRNEMFTVEPYGLAMPWTRVPPAKYFIWEYSGPIVRSEARYREMMADAGASERLAGNRALAFIRELEARVNAGQLLYNDGSIALWRSADSPALSK